MGAVRIVKYIEENCKIRSTLHNIVEHFAHHILILFSHTKNIKDPLNTHVHKLD